MILHRSVQHRSAKVLRDSKRRHSVVGFGGVGRPAPIMREFIRAKEKTASRPLRSRRQDAKFSRIPQLPFPSLFYFASSRLCVSPSLEMRPPRDQDPRRSREQLFEWKRRRPHARFAQDAKTQSFQEFHNCHSPSFFTLRLRVSA